MVIVFRSSLASHYFYCNWNTCSKQLYTAHVHNFVFKSYFFNGYRLSKRLVTVHPNTNSINQIIMMTSAHSMKVLNSIPSQVMVCPCGVCLFALCLCGFPPWFSGLLPLFKTCTKHNNYWSQHSAEIGLTINNYYNNSIKL